MMKKSKDNNPKIKSLGTINDYSKTLSPSDRRSSILRISGNRNRNIGEVLLLNECVLIESEVILNKKGRKYQVNKGKSDRRKNREGNCYPNSVRMMRKGYDYVEGYVKRKQDGYTFGHSWNVDSDGNHLDFTLKDPENYDYFGIIIPEKVVWDVGERNGHTWYCVLPFINDDFNYREV